MFVKPRSSIFIDNLTIEVEEAVYAPVSVTLRSEDGKICCRAQKSIRPGMSTISWEGLNDLPYGVYTLECSQGDEVIEVRMVKRV